VDAGPDAPSTGPLPESALVYAGGVDGSQGVIVLYRLDHASGRLTLVQRVTAGKSAGFLAFDLPHHALYDADDSAMRVRRFALDETTGIPGSPSDVGASGNPVHVSRTADGKFVLTAAYNEGRIETFSVNGSTLGASLGAVTAGTWSHAIVLSPDERYAFVPCKGVDRIERYDFDKTTGHLTTPPVNTATKAGDGPRHFAFHPSGAYAYLVNELGNAVYAYGYEAATGTLTELQRLSTLPDGFSSPSTGAEVFVTASGKYVYASNRIAGQNGSLAMFRVGADGKLTSMGQRTTGGHTPRSFAIDPTDRVVIAANQDSNTLAVLAIDPTTGALAEPTGTAITDIGMSPSYVGIVLHP
jgi:6-phosphogluconolactonase